MSRSFVCGVLAAMLSVGCSEATIKPPLTITTKAQPNLVAPANAPRVVGSSCGRVILFVIPISVATAEHAFANALEKAPGADTLLEYETRSHATFIPPFFYEMCFDVHGIAVTAAQLAPDSPPPVAPASPAPR